jgi:hypothetical protein
MQCAVPETETASRKDRQMPRSPPGAVRRDDAHVEHSKLGADTVHPDDG